MDKSELKTGDKVQCVKTLNSGFEWVKGQTYLVNIIPEDKKGWHKGDVFIEIDGEKAELDKPTETMGYVLDKELTHFKKL